MKSNIVIDISPQVASTTFGLRSQTCQKNPKKASLQYVCSVSVKTGIMKFISCLQ